MGGLCGRGAGEGVGLEVAEAGEDPGGAGAILPSVRPALRDQVAQRLQGPLDQGQGPFNQGPPARTTNSTQRKAPEGIGTVGVGRQGPCSCVAQPTSLVCRSK